MTSSGKMKKVKPTSEEGPKPLPDSYGITEANLLPRDPNWMFVYWEITAETADGIKEAHGEDIFEKSESVIRTYFAEKPEKYFDVPVMLDAKNWYINAKESGKSYYCELGLARDGKFIPIVRTNSVALPSGKVSDVTDEKWMSVSKDFEKLLQLSGIEYIGKGSGEVAKTLGQRWEMLRAVFSRSASWGISSLAAARHERKEKGFWLVADCEVILYGATDPGARVTISGRKISLNPDGTFSLRFALPDGNLNLPVMALSKDESEKREIEININRSTKK